MSDKVTVVYTIQQLKGEKAMAGQHIPVARVEDAGIRLAFENRLEERLKHGGVLATIKMGHTPSVRFRGNREKRNRIVGTVTETIKEVASLYKSETAKLQRT